MSLASSSLSFWSCIFWCFFLVKHLEKTTYVGCLNSTYYFFNQKKHVCFLPPWLSRSHHRLQEPKNTPNLPPLRETSIHLLTRQSPTIPLESWWRNGNLTNLLRYPNTNTPGRIFLKGPCVLYIWGRPLRYVLWLVLNFDHPEGQTPVLMESN